MKFVKKPGGAGLLLLASMLFRGLQCASFPHARISTWRGSVLCTHAGAMRLPHRDLIDAADRSRRF